MADEKHNWLGPYIPEGNFIRELVQQGKLVYHLMLDPRVHPLTKLIPIAALAYVISPVDLIADVIPVLGQADDVAVLIFGTRLFVELAPPEVVREHLQRLAGTVRGDWHVADNPPPGKPSAGREIVDGTFREDDKA